EKEAIVAGSPSAIDNNAKDGRPGETTSNRGRKRQAFPTRHLTTNNASTSASATEATTSSANMVTMELDVPVDPNEPTYCFCSQVSYGEMVACDNPDCKIEWFHYGCVGLKEQPKGKWYCSECVGTRRRRRAK
ncbi:hypothetical protein M569_05572, partial [Genlisea aurea]